MSQKAQSLSNKRFGCLVLTIVLIAGFGCASRQQDAAQVNKPARFRIFKSYEDVPCPPELLAPTIDRLIVSGHKHIKAQLVEAERSGPHHYAWLISTNGRPVMVISECPSEQEATLTSGITERALKRARTFLAEHRERSGNGTDYCQELAKLESSGIVTQKELDLLATRHQPQEHVRAWSVNKQYAAWEHQTRTYKIQISEIELIDDSKEEWNMTAQSIGADMGGQIWMYFKRDSNVSAEFGR